MVGKLPEFLLIGAAKSGTTMLYDLLKQHPNVFMPHSKEPRFFIYKDEVISAEDKVNKKTVTNEREYKALFAQAGDRISGEASGYLVSKKACDLIHAQIPDVRLIAVLRNPIDRVFSHYTFAVMKGFENEKSFTNVIQRDITDLNSSRNYLRHGLYAEHLKTYLDKFNSSQFLILLYEDLISNPISSVKRIYEHIGVSPDFTPTMNVKKNVSGKIRSKFVNNLYQKDFVLRKLLKQVIPTKIKTSLIRLIEKRNIEKVTIKDSDKTLLREFYIRDIAELENILNKDLSHWLQK